MIFIWNLETIVVQVPSYQRQFENPTVFNTPLRCRRPAGPCTTDLGMRCAGLISLSSPDSIYPMLLWSAVLKLPSPQSQLRQWCGRYGVLCLSSQGAIGTN